MANPAEPFRPAGVPWCPPAIAHSDVSPEARMDGSHFDTFVRTLAMTRLTRVQTLRGLAAAGAAALIGITLGAEEGGAKKNHERKVKVCKCPDSNAANCRTVKVKRSRAKKQARKACNYKGACRAGVTSCAAALTPAPNPGFQCTNNNDCTGGLVCIRQTCQACTETRQCGGNQVCLNGTCQTPGPGPGPVCPASCPFCQVCNAATGQCEVCPGNCRTCITLADRSTVCAAGVQLANSCTPGSCTSASDCTDPNFPLCVRSTTNLNTGVTSVIACPGIEVGRCGIDVACF